MVSSSKSVHALPTELNQLHSGKGVAKAPATGAKTTAIVPVKKHGRTRHRISHIAKTLAHRILYFYKVDLPPVRIPSSYKRMHMLMVSGENVPFTREMWERKKHAWSCRCSLATIHEERTSK